jgi:hypothetical protein
MAVILEEERGCRTDTIVKVELISLGREVVVHVTLTKVVSSNTTQGEVYSIQHYVTKFVSDL